MVKAVTEMKVADLLKEYKDTFQDHWEMYDKTFMALKKRLIEESLEAERSEFICSRYYQRSKERKDYVMATGNDISFLRTVVSKSACLRIRSGGYESRVIPKYIQRMPEVNETLKRIFLYGASTRLTGEALQPLIGETVSAQTISNITKSLDDEVRKFHTRILEDTYLYLFLDGIVLKVKTGFGSKKKIILVVYGITHYGKRELIDFIVTKHESEKAWEVFLNNIYRRGLRGTTLQLIITDGSPGLIDAVDMVYPHIPRQRCWVHKLRNMTNYTRKRDRETCQKEVRRIYDAKDRREAIEAYFKWAKK